MGYEGASLIPAQFAGCFFQGCFDLPAQDFHSLSVSFRGILDRTFSGRTAMKLLHICAVGFTVKNLLLPQIDYFRDRSVAVEVACSPGAEVKQLQQAGYIIHPITIDRRIAPMANLRSVAQLAALMRRQQYDLVHVHTPIASVLGRVAAKLAVAPKVLYTAHGFYFHDRMSPNKYRFYHSIERGAGWLTDWILTQSREDLETARQSGICANRASYLGNGVDLQRFRGGNLEPAQQQTLRRSLGLPDEAALIIGMTGRITEEKGYRELVEALARLREPFPQLHLLVIGGQLSSERDAFQEQLRDRIHQAGLADCVIFTGFRSDIPELLGLVDIFTLPSYREGLPRSILEAMAMELPVVATNIRGCREAVVEGETGFIVPPEDSDALAEALGKLLADEELRSRFGQAGRRRVEAEYDEQLVFQRLEACYKMLGVL